MGCILILAYRAAARYLFLVFRHISATISAQNFLVFVQNLLFSGRFCVLVEWNLGKFSDASLHISLNSGGPSLVVGRSIIHTHAVKYVLCGGKLSKISISRDVRNG